MARNSTERLGGGYDLESRRSAFLCTPAGVNTAHTSIYKCDIILVLKWGVILRDPLYCCTVLYLTYSFLSFLANCAFVTRTNRVVFEINLHLLTAPIIIRSECSFRESCPHELAHSSSYSQRGLDLGRVVSLLTARPLEF